MKRILILLMALTLVFSVCAPAVFAADAAPDGSVPAVAEHETAPAAEEAPAPEEEAPADETAPAEQAPAADEAADAAEEEAPAQQGRTRSFGTKKNILWGGICVLSMAGVYVAIRIKMKKG